MTDTEKYNFSEMNEETFREILNKVMNLGMAVRQDQLRGYSDKSGNEVLDEWIEEKIDI